jgi:uncharacterized protein (TIGR03086 family)
MSPVPSRELLLTAAGLMARSLHDAGDAWPTRPTPCAEWQLGQLVHHVADSATTLAEIIAGPEPAGPSDVTGCARAARSLDRLRRSLADAPLANPVIDLAALAGAFELTIHAWDIDTSAGVPRRLPAEHVSALLRLAPLVLGDIDRCGLFGPDLAPPPAGDTQRLLALFGRRAGWPETAAGSN